MQGGLPPIHGAPSGSTPRLDPSQGSRGIRLLSSSGPGVAGTTESPAVRNPFGVPIHSESVPQIFRRDVAGGESSQENPFLDPEAKAASGSTAAEKGKGLMQMAAASAGPVRSDNGHNTEAKRLEAATRQRAFCDGLGVQYDRSVWDEVFYALNGSLREQDEALPSDYCMTLRREDVFDLSFVSREPLRISAHDLPRLEAYRAERRERIEDLVSTRDLQPDDLEAFDHAVQQSNETQREEGGLITFRPLYGEVSFVTHLSEGYRPVTDYYFGRDSSGSMTLPGSVISTSQKYATYLQQVHPQQKFYQKGGIFIAALRRHEEEFLKVAITFDSVSAAVGPRLAQRTDLDENGCLTPAAREAGKLVFYAPPLRLNSTNQDNFRISGRKLHLRESVPICSIQDLIAYYRQAPGGRTPLTSFALAVKGEMTRTREEYPDARFALALSSDGAETGLRPGTNIGRQAHESWMP